MANASKYDPLEDYLKQAEAESLPMGFSEIESVLGFELPPSSRTQRAWWSNNPSNNVMTKAWIGAGYETIQVDMEAETLIFKRSKAGKPPVRMTQTPPRAGPRRHPLFGAMKGLLTVPADLDLTQPADADWGQVYDD